MPSSDATQEERVQAAVTHLTLPLETEKALRLLVKEVIVSSSQEIVLEVFQEDTMAMLRGVIEAAQPNVPSEIVSMSFAEQCEHRAELIEKEQKIEEARQEQSEVQLEGNDTEVEPEPPQYSEQEISSARLKILSLAIRKLKSDYRDCYFMQPGFQVKPAIAGLFQGKIDTRFFRARDAVEAFIEDPSEENLHDLKVILNNLTRSTYLGRNLALQASSKALRGEAFLTKQHADLQQSVIKTLRGIVKCAEADTKSAVEHLESVGITPHILQKNPGLMDAIEEFENASSSSLTASQ